MNIGEAITAALLTAFNMWIWVHNVLIVAKMAVTQ